MTDKDNQPYAAPASQFSPGPQARPPTRADMLVRFFSPALLGLMAISLLRYAPYWMPNFIFGTACIVIALGLLFWETWAKYLWYAIAGLIILVWIGTNAVTIWSLSPPLHAWKNWLIAFLPGLSLVVVCGFGISATRASYARHVALNGNAQ